MIAQTQAILALLTATPTPSPTPTLAPTPTPLSSGAGGGLSLRGYRLSVPKPALALLRPAAFGLPLAPFALSRPSASALYRVTITYTYDPANRLTAVQGPSSTVNGPPSTSRIMDWETDSRICFISQ